MINRILVPLFLSAIIGFGEGVPPKSKSGSQNTVSTVAPTQSPRHQPSILDMFLPQSARDKSKSGSSNALQPPMASPFLNIAGLMAPPPTAQANQVNKQPKSIFDSFGDFSQLSRLCETMAAAGRARKVSTAVQKAARNPDDMLGWMQVIRQTEPIPLETFACQTLERIITNPDSFVADLMRIFMPNLGGGAGGNDLFPQFNFQPKSIPAPITTITASTTTPAPTSTSGSSIVSTTGAPMKKYDEKVNKQLIEFFSN